MTQVPFDSAWIQTHTGGRFYPFNPDPFDINIEDIAHALSHICRFSGHCSSYYSVAQHSVLVSHHVDPMHAAWGLLHDAAEAYLCDIPRPIKHTSAFNAYREAEAKIERAVAERFCLPPRMPDAVKRADNALLATEARDLMPKREVKEWAWLPEPLGLIIVPWTPEKAKAAFLARANELDLP